MHHNAVAAAEGVVHIRHGETDFLDLARCKRLRLLEAVAELAAKGLATHQLLISAEADFGRRNIGLLAPLLAFRLGRFGLGIVRRIHVDEFHIKIGIGAAGGNEQLRRNGAGNSDVFFKRRSLVN